MEDENIASYDVAVNETLGRMKLNRERAKMKANYKKYAAVPVIDEVAKETAELIPSVLINPFVVRVTKMPEIVRSIHKIYEMDKTRIVERGARSYLQALMDKINGDIDEKQKK